MSAQNKILIGFAAIVAFVIGFALNMSVSSDDIDTTTLLTAQLQISDPTVESNGEGEVQTTSLQDSLGKLTLVNFWASWCTPCREEMPVFETMYRQTNSAGFTVIGIAIDSPDKAQPMLDSMGITYPILYAQETGIDIMESVGNEHGLLPYSVLLDDDGKAVEQVLGQIHEQQISEWIATYL